MSMTCPKCGYIRKSTDEAPEWQCPSCGVAYIKASKSNQVLNLPPAKKNSSSLGVMGFVNAISDKIGSMRQHSKNKKEFFETLLRAANEGKLTDEEIKHLQSRCKELELTNDDLRDIRVQAYNAAFRAAKSDGKITSDEEAELNKLQKFLKIPDTEISKSKRELARLRVLTEVQNGNLPTAFVPNLILQKGEIAYWSEPGNILEERVVRRRYEGGSQSVSFRIAKGVSYRIGGHRGHVVADKAVIPVSSGELVITNKRVVFRGDAKSFNFKFDKLLDINFYSDGVRLTDDKGKPRIVKFSNEGNTDIVGTVLSHTINNYLG